MPIYEYKCQQCGEVSEYRVSAQSGKQNISCRGCGSSKVEKLISVPSISTGRSEPAGQTCCGRSERCSDGGSCCGH